VDRQSIKKALLPVSKFRFGLSSLMWSACMIALALGWYLDQVRLNSSLASVQMMHERRIDRMSMGFFTSGGAVTIANIFREHQKMDHDEFDRYLRGTVVATVIQLYAVRDRVDEVELDGADAGQQARELVTLLGCKSSSEFLAEAEDLGFMEEDFLYTYNPKPGEIEDFYKFLGTDGDTSR
jgi:hypothetical protein